MACVNMSLDSMIQNKRGNRVRGGRRGVGLRGVRGRGGTFGGARRLDGHSCRAPLGLRGVRGTFGGARRLNGHLCRAPLGLRSVRGPRGTFGGAGQLDGPPRQAPLGLRGVRGPGGSSEGAGRLDRPPRRGPLATYGITKTVHKTRNLPRESSVLEDRFKAVGSSGVESGTNLQVSNLDAGVSNEDLRDLFSEIGELIRYGIHYDKDGSPCGSAEVVFARGSDAFQVVKRFNSTDLKGKPMKIEKVGRTVRAHVASRLNMIGGANGRRTRMMPGPSYTRDASILNNGAGSSRQRRCSGWNGGAPIRGRGCHGRDRNHGGLGGRPVKKSAEELDKELENDQAETS